MLDELIQIIAVLDAIEVDDRDVARYIADNADARLSDLLNLLDLQP